MKYKHYL